MLGKNMKTLFRILPLSCLIACNSVCAQELSDAKEIQMNHDALIAFENYEKNASLSSNAARMEFDLLFDNMKIKIFNDLNGLSAEPTLTVEKYANTLRSKGRNTEVILKNLKKGEPYYEDGHWKLDFTFDKEISYANACQFKFSSSKYFGADFHMRMSLAWDEEQRKCFITRLDGVKGSDVPMLPADYTILNNDDERYSELTIDGMPVDWNADGQAILPPNPQFEYPDQEVIISVKEKNPNCRLIKVNFEPKRWRVKAHLDFGLSDYYKGDGSAWLNSSGKEFTVEAGYYFHIKNNVRWGAFWGLGFANSKLDMSREKIAYSYPTYGEADINQNSYTRFYDIVNIYQSFKSIDAVIPMYIDMDYRYNKHLSLYADAGFKVYLNLHKKVVWNSGSYSTWGYYDQDGAGTQSGVNGFVTDQPISDQDVERDYTYKALSIDGLLRAGARVLLRQNLFLDAGLSFQRSMLSPFNSDPSMNNLSNGEITSNDALMTYSTGEGEKMHTLINGLSSLGRQSLQLNIGLMYRF